MGCSGVWGERKLEKIVRSDNGPPLRSMVLRGSNSRLRFKIHLDTSEEGGVAVVLLGSRFSIEFDPVASLIIIPSPIHFIYRDTSKGASSLFLKEHPPWSTLFFLELYIGSPQPLHLSSSSPLRGRFYSGISTGHSSDGNVFSPIIPRSFYPELSSPTFWIIFGTKRKYSSRFVNFTGYSTPTNLHDFNDTRIRGIKKNPIYFFIMLNARTMSFDFTEISILQDKNYGSWSNRK